jgi:hypothetical protein
MSLNMKIDIDDLDSLETGAKVFVIQDDGHKNLFPAKKFGQKFVVLATKDLPLYRNPTATISGVLSRLQDYDPKQDYVIMTGDPLLIGIVTAYIIKQFGTIRCLKWDKQNIDYFPITLSL